MPAATAVPLIVADGDIATTWLLARELGAAWTSVDVRTPETLFGTRFEGRPVIVSRLCHPTYRWLPDYLASRGVRYAWFVDDNFWELDEAVDPAMAPFYGHPAVRESLARFIGGAEVVVAWSARLAAELRRRFPGANVAHTDAGIDFDAIEAIAPAPARDDGVVRIGYPTSRRVALASFLTTLVRHAEAAHGARVRFEFVGWMPDPLEGRPYVTLTPLIRDYGRYLAHARSRGWDIGIAPLGGSRFETYKTDIKFREYAAMNVAGVYSRESPYTESVDDGRTGVLAGSAADAWIAAIDGLVASPARRRAIASAAHDEVKRNRDVKSTGKRLAALLPANA